MPITPRMRLSTVVQVVLLAEKDAEINPDRPQARAALLEAYFRLGRAYGFDRDLEQAELWFRKMESLAERWIADEPANVLARDQLATSHRKIADVRKLAGDDVAARAEYVKAVDLGRELLLGRAGECGRQAASRAGTRRPGDDAVEAWPAQEAAPLERQARAAFFTSSCRPTGGCRQSSTALSDPVSPRLSRDGPASR